MSGLSVAVVVVVEGVAGPPAASALSCGQDVVLYEADNRLGSHAHPHQPPPPPARGGVGAPAGARGTYGLPGVGSHPRTPTGAPRSHPAAHHRLPSRTVHEQPVRPRHVPETRKGLL
ncbi:hypothetical protein ACFXPW_09060 [Streptomyces goshikiensis]|uniref:hypothetical protein n=1 Tax=Streptomyces goshikiensis TaxID=1942 RepID=UPI0036C296CE